MMADRVKRAAIYVRVSSEQQASEGKGSLGDQGRELKALPISTVTASRPDLAAGG